jgi:MFS family permease
MKPEIFVKLSLMMLLQYFIWGAWYVTMGTYMSTFLGSSGVQIGAAYSALAIATMISPFFVGMVADRYFAAQRIMAILHLVGAVLLYLATQITDNTAFYWIILLYSLLYMPTIALSNSIAFSQMTDPGKQCYHFSRIGAHLFHFTEHATEGSHINKCIHGIGHGKFFLI